MTDDHQARERLAREIEHHRRIADRAERIWSWETPSGRRRAERRAQLLIEEGQILPGVHALELGCGTGVFLEMVAKTGATVHGLDLSEHLLEKARAKLSDTPNVTLDQGNAEQMPYADGTFDVVYGSSVLHHLDLIAALREVRRVLKPGGRLAFAEPNIVNPHVAFLFYSAPTRERFGVSPDEMAFSRFRARDALEQAGFSDIQVRLVDFLHPAIPAPLLGAAQRLSVALEKVPLVREISGSLLMSARRA